KSGQGVADFQRKVILDKIPFFALAAASCVVTFLAQKSGGAVATLEAIPFGARTVNAVVSYGRYLAKIVWPTNLAVIYPAEFHWGVGALLLTGAVMAALTGLALWQLNRRPYLAVGWAWFLGMLVPVIGLVQVGNQAIADRYTYLPAVGLFMMISWGLGELAGVSDGRAFWKSRQAIASLAAVVVVLACTLV